jgi:hypothetical protein
MKCPKPLPATTALTAELGGRRVTEFRATKLLCAPASGSPVPMSLPTATTLPSEACHFGDHERQCVGSCAAGGQCSAIMSGGACECRTTCDCVGIP